MDLLATGAAVAGAAAAARPDATCAAALEASDVSRLPQCSMRSVSECEALGIDLATVHVEPTDPVLQHVTTLLQLVRETHLRATGSHSRALTLSQGRVPAFVPPEVGTVLSVSVEQGQSSIPVVGRVPKPRLFDDTHVREMLKKHPIDFVVCSSALVQIIDNCDPRARRQWQIPVAIQSVAVEQEAPSSSGGSTTGRKVVFLEKPLVSDSYTNCERNQLFAKACLMQQGSRPAALESIQFAASMVRDAKASISLPLLEDARRNALPRENLTYNLWRFGPWHVLVRCGIDGVIADPSTPQGYRFVGVKAKPEFLEEFGDDETLLSETARWWIHTFLRPDAHLFVGAPSSPVRLYERSPQTYSFVRIGRYSVASSRVLSFQRLDMPAILPASTAFQLRSRSRSLARFVCWF